MKFDIRWKQRFGNYQKALDQLTRFMEKKDLSEMESQGMIQSFEYCFELSWNVIKDFFVDQGDTSIMGSRDAFRLAFKRGLIHNGERWMDMIKSRQLTTHTYDTEMATEIVKKIRIEYYPNLISLRDYLEKYL